VRVARAGQRLEHQIAEIERGAAVGQRGCICRLAWARARKYSKGPVISPTPKYQPKL
jgi:hypothetical protein